MTPAWIKRAKPGDKVVCVDAPDHTMWLDGCPAPMAGEVSVGSVYTIRAIAKSSLSKFGVIFYFGTKVEGGKVWYDTILFRPVFTSSTSVGMATLKSILHGAPVTKTEVA